MSPVVAARRRHVLAGNEREAREAVDGPTELHDARIVLVACQLEPNGEVAVVRGMEPVDAAVIERRRQVEIAPDRAVAEPGER